MKTTAPHEMDKRIRFGSDGNGIFVALSRDGGRTWRHYDDVVRFAASAEGLLADELRAGVGYLDGTWSPSQPLPRSAEAIQTHAFSPCEAATTDAEIQ